MEVLVPAWRKWMIVFLGAYLFTAPWIFGVSGAEASSVNDWIVGACIVVTTLRVPIVSGPRVAERIKVGLGTWLLVSPVALGFAGSGAAWDTWIVGALIIALADTLILAFDFLGWIHAQRLRYQARMISPEKLLRYGEREEHMHPERLCRHIVECSYEIRRSLLGQKSGVEAGMCIRGYRACLNGGITLNRLIYKELPEYGLLRRLRLKIARRQVVHSLSRVREVLPRVLRRPGTGAVPSMSHS
ncbi:MAG: SPW repeat protein [Actinomycetota bacterium]|nr:SPW repeat protein [Actinomycetota bacterium]